MDADFQIAIEPEHLLLKLTLGGFFHLDDVRRFAEAKARAHMQLGAPPHTHVTLVDVRECRIQMQEVATLFGAVIREPRYAARRLAFLTAGSLAKMQVRRLLEGMTTVRQFDDEGSARAWLFEREQKVA